MSEDDHEAAIRSANGNAGEQAAEDLSAFTTIVTDFYRAAVDRSTTWRGRLDQTTNWAVVIVAAILTWAFAGGNRPHYIILIGVFGVTAFLFIEAHRYREYDVWRNRVRTLQANYIAEAFSPEGAADDNWQTRFSSSLRNPAFEISFFRAVCHRLRRTYLALLLILFTAWIARITIYSPQNSWQQTASISSLPGEAVVGFVAVFYVAIVILTFTSARSTGIREFRE